MNWSNITLKKYYQIQDVLTLEDDYTILNLIDIVYDVDSQSLPIYQLNNFDISFLQTKVPTTEMKKQYTINGTVYNSNCDISRVTAAQFIDYQNYIKKTPIRFEDILSVFFIPEGCTNYNTDYDIEKVKQDLLDLPITDVHTISFFFKKQLQIFVTLFHYSLINQVKTMKMDKKKKQQIIEQIHKMISFNSELSHTFLNTVK